MKRHLNRRDGFREADSSNRLKIMLKQKSVPAHNDTKYEEGDEVFVQVEHKDQWEGPFKVKCHHGKEVKVIRQGNEYSVHQMRVQPVVLKNSEENNESVVKEKSKGETKETEESESEEVSVLEYGTNDTTVEKDVYGITKLRPRIRREIEFKVYKDPNVFIGKVKSVGKPNGKYKNRCVVEVEGIDLSYDFATEVEKWKYMDNPKLKFDSAVKSYEKDDTTKEVMLSDVVVNADSIKCKSSKMESRGIL